MTRSRILMAIMLMAVWTIAAAAQQPVEPRVALTEAAPASDAKGAPAIEAKLLSTVLNGSDDSPVNNVRLVVKNASPDFYTYVTGWATFYDSSAVRCGEGLFKVDALAPGESSETDTPGLRLKCTPASWRIVATNLLTRRADTAQEVVAPPPPPAPPPVERRPVGNFMLNISGADYPIQVDNPLVVRMGGKKVKIVLRDPSHSN
ncbi:MAG TPA: hypothetical protein VK475_02965 [Pyrinomonadaceae bacterium]|nr:hypothetical protein [Pyrinomonadaceae bacterium]